MKKPKKWIIFMIAILMVSGLSWATVSDFSTWGEPEWYLKWEKPKEVLIYSSNGNWSIDDEYFPVLTIHDKKGLKLFYNMLSRAKKASALCELDIGDPPYIAKVHYKDRVGEVDLCLFYPDDYHGYRGSYIYNGWYYQYIIPNKHVEAFLEEYKAELFMDGEDAE